MAAPPFITGTICDWLSRKRNVNTELASVCHSGPYLKKCPTAQSCEHE